MSTHRPHFEDPSDERLHRTLNRLPDMQAPDTLIPGVLAAIRAREAAAAAPIVAWYRRPATTWPPALRIALGVSTLTVLGILAFGAHQLWPVGDPSGTPGFLSQVWDLLDAIASTVRTLIGACFIALRRYASSPVLMACVGMVAVSYFALLGIGGAVWRTAMQTSRR
jgi:hypothetical protein